MALFEVPPRDSIKTYGYANPSGSIIEWRSSSQDNVLLVYASVKSNWSVSFGIAGAKAIVISVWRR